MNVIIMAQGQATRFPGKHFAQVNGEPIIQRTVRMLRELSRGCVVTVVAAATDEFKSLGCLLYTQQDPGDGLMTGLYNTRHLWGAEDTVILLGDVVFSRSALEQILTSDRRLALFGRTGRNHFTGCAHSEIFALLIRGLAARVQDAIATRELRIFSDGRLWGLKHHLSERAEWVEIDDWTDDVDTPEDLKGVQGALDKLVSCVVTSKGRLEHVKISLPLIAQEFDGQNILVDYDCPEGSGAWASEQGVCNVVHVSDRPFFHKTHALNTGARSAHDARWLCFVDADVMVNPGIRSALFDLAENDCRRIVVAHHSDAKLVGFLFVSREAFEAVGGYDERFEGWGYQDTDLRLRLIADARCTPLALAPGLLTSLNHPDELRYKYQREPYRVALEKNRRLYLEHLAQREPLRTPAWKEFIDRWRGDDIGK